MLFVVQSLFFRLDGYWAVPNLIEQGRTSLARAASGWCYLPSRCGVEAQVNYNDFRNSKRVPDFFEMEGRGLFPEQMVLPCTCVPGFTVFVQLGGCKEHSAINWLLSRSWFLHVSTFIGHGYLQPADDEWRSQFCLCDHIHLISMNVELLHTIAFVYGPTLFNVLNHEVGHNRPVWRKNSCTE